MVDICGIDPANYKGKCEKGVNSNSDLCSYNSATKNCNKKSKKTWAQIEAEFKAHVPEMKAEKIMVPLEAVAKVIDAEEKTCGIQASPFVGKCQGGISTYSEYCKRGTQGNCVKGTAKTWIAIKKELSEMIDAPMFKEKPNNVENGNTAKSEIPKLNSQISRQLENYLSNIDDLHQVHDLSDNELELLLKNIKIETGKKTTLMDIVNDIASQNRLTTKELYNIKIKVLLDNLAKKMCRCVESVPGARSKVGLCRRSIFHNRGIDFYTYECLPDEKNPNRAPLLKRREGTDKIIQRYSKNNN